MPWSSTFHQVYLVWAYVHPSLLFALYELWTFGLSEDALNICLIYAKPLRYIFCLPLFQFKFPVDKMKRPLSELIQKYLQSWCMSSFFNIQNNPQIKHILSSLGYFIWVQIFSSITQLDNWALCDSNLKKEHLGHA